MVSKNTSLRNLKSLKKRAANEKMTNSTVRKTCRKTMISTKHRSRKSAQVAGRYNHSKHSSKRIWKNSLNLPTKNRREKLVSTKTAGENQPQIRMDGRRKVSYRNRLMKSAGSDVNKSLKMMQDGRGNIKRTPSDRRSHFNRKKNLNSKRVELSKLDSLGNFSNLKNDSCCPGINPGFRELEPWFADQPTNLPMNSRKRKTLRNSEPAHVMIPVRLSMNGIFDSNDRFLNRETEADSFTTEYNFSNFLVFPKMTINDVHQMLMDNIYFLHDNGDVTVVPKNVTRITPIFENNSNQKQIYSNLTVPVTRKITTKANSTPRSTESMGNLEDKENHFASSQFRK